MMSFCIVGRLVFSEELWALIARRTLSLYMDNQNNCLNDDAKIGDFNRITSIDHKSLYVMQHDIKQVFLRERLIELFHKDTIDSYRVRIHNTNSLLKELKQLLIGWDQKRVQRFETVKLCAEELCISLKQDDYYDTSIFGCRDIFVDEINILIKSENKPIDVFHFVFLIDKLLDSNNLRYIENIFTEIENVVFQKNDFDDKEFIPIMNSINKLTSLMATELINLGYSKTYLYIVLNSVIKKPLSVFEYEFQLFRELVLNRKYINFIVVFKLISKTELTNISFINDLKNHIPSKHLHLRVKEKYASFIASDNYSKFAIFEVKALDQFSAIKQSKIRLSELFDRIHLGYNGFEAITHSQALVINKVEKSKARLNSSVYLFDGIFESNKDLYVKFDQFIRTISANENIAQDVKDRLYSALRYLRMGSSAIEIEQRFIDYWIGLEFIFSSPQKGQATYTRLKDNMINILSSCYLKRNFSVLNHFLIKEGYVSENDFFWLLEKVEFDELLNKIPVPLLRYHVQKKKSIIFESSEKRKIYITNHIENLNQNISRIYHLRNELIHEAALKQDIENITSNLRYYLVFVLNQLISYFSKLPNTITDEKKLYTLDDMFSEFKMLKKQIEKEWNLEVILAIPVEMDLLEKK